MEKTKNQNQKTKPKKRTSHKIIFSDIQPWALKQSSAISKDWGGISSLGTLPALDSVTSLGLNVDIYLLEYELDGELHIFKSF